GGRARRLRSEGLGETGRGADLILGNNVLAHTPYLNDFVAGLAQYRGPGIVPDTQLAEVEAGLQNPVDNPRLAEHIARFFKARVLA
ncbi:MAG: hypothetical protein AAFY14_02475, partial [Pseudomonadota bacterium]